MPFMRSALIAALAAGAVACNSASEDDSGVSDTIGAAGGTVSHPDGVAIEIPAGALSTPTTISIQRGGTQAGAPMYLFKPEALHFDGDAVATVSFPVAGGATEASVYWTHTGDTQPGGTYDALPTSVASGLARASVAYLAWGHVGQACDAAATCNPGVACHVEGIRACTTGAPVCETTVLAQDGAACGTGNAGLCNAGVCELNPCNRVDLSAATLVDAELAGSLAAAPTPQGGTVADGTYFLTAVNYFGTQEAIDPEFRKVLTISSSGTRVEVAFLAAVGIDRINANLALATPALTLTVSCPSEKDGDVISYQYTVTSGTVTELRLYYTDATGLQNRFEEVYVLQQP
jgi:hypothetical protein